MEQSSEQSADRSMDQDGGRWLTYPELASVRGIDKPSAIRLATRKKWRRQRDNRRIVRVLVPSEWLSPRYQSMDLPMEQPARDMDLSSNRPDFAAALAAVEAAHAGEVAALHGQINGLKTLADRTMAQLTEATARVGDAERRADRLEQDLAAAHVIAQAAQRTAREAVEQARAEAVTARDTAEALRRADEARKARGRWRAAWAAWRRQP